MIYCALDLSSDGAIGTAHPADAAIVRAWIGEGHPLIARMRRDDDLNDRIAFGLPLPLQSGKKRIALTVTPSAVRTIESPPLLRDALGVLPQAWKPRIASLAEDLTPHADSVRAVGSLAWQFLTGEIYLHPKSDIDVILHISRLSQLRAALQILQDSDLSPGPRIDGEIVVRQGEAVAWRELLGSSRDILVKTLGGPRICLRDQWLSDFYERAT
jgi:phosphoribosyl-dephospho-CoA transferase